MRGPVRETMSHIRPLRLRLGLGLFFQGRKIGLLPGLPWDVEEGSEGHPEEPFHLKQVFEASRAACLMSLSFHVHVPGMLSNPTRHILLATADLERL